MAVDTADFCTAIGAEMICLIPRVGDGSQPLGNAELRLGLLPIRPGWSPALPGKQGEVSVRNRARIRPWAVDEFMKTKPERLLFAPTKPGRFHRGASGWVPVSRSSMFLSRRPWPPPFHPDDARETAGARHAPAEWWTARMKQASESAANVLLNEPRTSANDTASGKFFLVFMAIISQATLNTRNMPASM